MSEHLESATTTSEATTVVSAKGVECLSRMPGCELAEGAPDVRGWEVTSPTSVHLGVVKDLLVDLATQHVRYLDVVLEADGSPARRVILPIGKVWINDALDEVIIDSSLALDALPAYDPASFDREFEHRVLAALGHRVEADFYGGPAFATGARRGRAQDGSCARRESDPAGAACSIDPTAAPEAANGVELPVVADAAD